MKDKLAEKNYNGFSTIENCYLHYICLILCFWIPLWASETQYNAVQYTVEDGLSSNNIYDIYQDKIGYMWFCTDAGLDRFDGYEFRKYKYIPGDSTSLSSGWVWSALEDHLGNFWVTTANGLNLYDRYTDTFAHLFHNPHDSLSLSSNNIRALLEDRRGNLWLGTQDNGLNRLVRSSRTFKHYLSGVTILELHENESTEDLWIGTSRGIYKYDSNIDRIIRPKILQQFEETKTYSVNCVQQVDNTLYFAAWEHNVLFKVDLAEPTKIDRINGVGHGDIYYNKDTGLLWYYKLGCLRCLSQIKIDGEKKSRDIMLMIKGKQILNKSSITKIFRENTGSFWIATSENGLLYFNELGSQFKEHLLFYSKDPMMNKANGLPGTCATDLAYDMDGHLWYSSWGGVYRLSKDRKSAKLYLDYSKANIYQSPAIINQIFTKKNGELFCASSYGGGLHWFRKNSGDFEHFFIHSDVNNQGLASDQISTLFEDKYGRFWIGHCYDGIDLYDENDGKYINFRHEEGRHTSLSNNQIRAISDADSGKLWIGTRGAGLNLFNPANNTAVHFRYGKKSKNCLSDDIINSMMAMDDSILWIGTSTGGLNKFNTTTRKFKHFLMEDGLPSNDILNVTSDLNGDIWIATEIGLARIDKESENIQVYDHKDGLTNTSSFTYHSSCLSPTGELFWGHYGGFISVIPDSLKENTFIPPVVLTDFQISYQPAKLDTAIGKKKHIILTHKQKLFSFQFAALNYFAPERNQYRYKLEGFDQNWIEAGTRNFASYTNISPGNYTFRVSGSNDDGIWNEEGTSIRITILPPWWRTNWAYTIYIILIGFAVYMTYYLQLRRIRLKHNLELEHVHAEKLAEVDHLKSRFFANISHEFRTPLTLILGPVQSVLSKIGDIGLKNELNIVLRNVNRLERLINQLLDLSRLEAGKMELKVQEVDIIPLLRKLVLAFTSLAERKEITLKFKCKTKTILTFIDLDKIEKIMNNLLSNAFKFTPKGGVVEVAVENKPTPLSPPRRGIISSPSREARLATGQGLGVGKELSDHILISISNTGPGIPPNQLDKIFERFYQIEHQYQKEPALLDNGEDTIQTSERYTHSTGEQGSGIGLALVKELVELHHGTIHVQCKRKGTQSLTTFTILVPLSREQYSEDEIIDARLVGDKDEIEIISKGIEVSDQGYEEQEDTEILASPKTLPLVLLIEDNPDMRTYIRDHLKSYYRIVVAADGEKGWYMAKRRMPDLIISDIMMPKMDGFKVCQKIKSDISTSHIPLILLTARAELKDKLAGLELGADDYIPKPFAIEELQVRIKNLIEQRQKLRERFSNEALFGIQDMSFNQTDEQFLQKIIKVINQHISDPHFTVQVLSDAIGMNQTTLNQKLKALTGQSPHNFIRLFRLKKAAVFLRQKTVNVTEVAYEVGYKSLSHFSKAFQNQFGDTPSHFSAYH